MGTSLTEKQYDVIILGTGMVESILAAALARVGKEILHLDHNEYYGSNDATLALPQFRRIFEDPIDEEAEAEPPAVEEIMALGHRFSLDLCPKICLASEELVDVLIQSGVGQYFECTTIDASFMAERETFTRVPISKPQIFKTKALLNVDKRRLMKFIQFVLDYGDVHFSNTNVFTKNEREPLARGRSLKRPQNKSIAKLSETISRQVLAQPFGQVLQEHFQLSTKLQHMMIYTIGLAGKQGGCTVDGIRSVYQYLSSMGRFHATSPFLYPLYGCSEISQSFCRLAAVYGGIYVLRAPLQQLKLNLCLETQNYLGIQLTAIGSKDSNDVDHLLTRGPLLSHWLVSNTQYFPQYCLPEPRAYRLRKICILKDAEHLPEFGRQLFIFPPKTEPLQHLFPIHMLQLDSSSACCPKEYRVWQCSTLSLDRDTLVLDQACAHVIEHHLFQNEDASFIVWQHSFTSPCVQISKISRPPPQVLLCGEEEEEELELELGYERALRKAKALFDTICPGQDFLLGRHSNDPTTTTTASEGQEEDEILSQLAAMKDQFTDAFERSCEEHEEERPVAFHMNDE